MFSACEYPSSFSFNDPSTYTTVLNEYKSNGRDYSRFSKDQFTCLIRLFKNFMCSSSNMSAAIWDSIIAPIILSGCVLLGYANLCPMV